MKLSKKVHISVAVFIIALLINTLTVSSAYADTTTSTNQSKTGSAFFSVSSIIKNLFQKNVIEKKENLEKNKDIRNKLIEEKQEKLNIKFNRENEPELTPIASFIEATTTPEDNLVGELADQIMKLSDIKTRIDSRIEKLATTNFDVSKAIDASTLAGEKLTNASSSLAVSMGSTTDTVTEDELININHDALLDAVKNIKEAHLVLIEAIAALSGDTSIASTTAE